MPEIDSNELYTVAEAAEILGYTKNRVRFLARRLDCDDTYRKRGKRKTQIAIEGWHVKEMMTPRESIKIHDLINRELEEMEKSGYPIADANGRLTDKGWSVFSDRCDEIKGRVMAEAACKRIGLAYSPSL